MNITKELIECPRGTPGEEAIQIHLGKILEAEARQMEVAIVTPDKAPELLQAFNKAWTDLHKMMTLLSYEQTVAEKNANKRRAVVLLEVAPAALEAKGLGSSKDLRDAILDLDVEYQDAVERVDQIECVVEYIKGKLKSFENSFSSVKKIMQEDAYNMLSGKQDVPGGIPEQPTVGRVTTGFGKAKF